MKIKTSVLGKVAMSDNLDLSGFEVGYDIPASIGMDESEIQTPCLIIELNALERNIRKMGQIAKSMGVRHRAHGKMHKSVDVFNLQRELGGACGVCCQKVSEAEAFVRGGVKDVLISNQVRDQIKIDRLVRLTKLGASITVCVDDIKNVKELELAANKHGTIIHCLVEIDVGAERCGTISTECILEIATAITKSQYLNFSGIQAYQGAMQHLKKYEDRMAEIDIVLGLVGEAVNMLKRHGLDCKIVSGGGTGSYYFEGRSGIFNELQCGSYAFMDADYGRVLDKDGKRLDAVEWENALFVLTSVMSHTKANRAICDAGLKAHSVDSGLPIIFGRDDVQYVKCSDEHGVVMDYRSVLNINERLRLVPGHCDPTCNLHDWYVGVRDGKVETIWPITARGRVF